MVSRRNWLARKISAGERYTMDVLKIPKHAWRWKNNQQKWNTRLDFFRSFFSYHNETETKEQWLERQRNFELTDPEELQRGTMHSPDQQSRPVCFLWVCTHIQASQSGVY